jgi:hypothetical protein
MPSNHLTLRLTRDDTLLIERLQVRTGSSKSDLVKQALRTLASQQESRAPIAQSLYALGEGRFGQQGVATRQSANIKRVVRARLEAKRRT